jgi:PRTRC genetic system ThiF family protein
MPEQAVGHLAQVRMVAPQLDQQLRILLVGCGGTGSWLAPHIARLVLLLKERGKDASALFIDPDVVEPKNIPRQNFCQAEAWGRVPKAVTLARRLSAAWGLEIPALVEPFRPALASSFNGLTVLVGCVDGPSGRQALSEALSTGYRLPQCWWLDCGNHESSGQVLLGNVTRPRELQEGLKSARLCLSLPAPSWQHPELLEAGAEAAESVRSCADLALANAQALNINVAVAAIAAEYLNQLLLVGTLTTFATYVKLAPLTVGSSPITDQLLARFLVRQPDTV